MTFSSFLKRNVPLNLFLNNFDLRQQIIKFTAKKETNNNLLFLETEIPLNSNNLITSSYQKVMVFYIKVTNLAHYRP